MHFEAMSEMTGILDGFKIDFAKVLDVGSLDVNGSYRGMVEARGWSYTGLDLEDGPNVDMVSCDPYSFPVVDSSYDIIISGSTMEHVRAFWKWIPELERIVKPGGKIVILTHTSWTYHPHPVDCWRVMPDGMRFILEESGLTVDSIEMFTSRDISAVARKEF